MFIFTFYVLCGETPPNTFFTSRIFESIESRKKIKCGNKFEYEITFFAASNINIYTPLRALQSHHFN